MTTAYQLATDVYDHEVWEDSPAVVFERIKGLNGADITQVSVSAITCKAYDEEDPDTVIASPTVTVATSVFNTLQTSANHSGFKRTGGYNFQFTVPGTCFPTGGQVVIVEFTFTDTDGNLLIVQRRCRVRNRLGG